MRTTLTLEADVEAALERAVGARQQPFKTVVNEALRRGLATIEPPSPQGPIRVTPVDMGLRAGLDHGRLNQLVDELETGRYDAPTPNASAAVHEDGGEYTDHHGTAEDNRGSR